MTEPLVSILIPVYNAGEYLRLSVRSILSQTYSNLEILIIDDGSTDGCMDSISDIDDLRLSVIRKENGGRATALNRGLDELAGEFYATHDADDISHPQRIERQVQCMLDNPNLAAVFTGHDIIFAGRRIAPQSTAKSVQRCRRDIEQIRMPTLDPTGMFRVPIVRSIRYEPSLKVGAAYDYILRLGEKYPIMVLGENLYSHRIHPGSVCAQDPYRERNMVRQVLRRACERRQLDPTVHLSSQSRTVIKFPYRKRETWLIAHFMESVLSLRHAGRTGEALKTALACLRLHPCDPYYYKPLAYFLAPLTLIKYYRSRKVKFG